MNGVVVPAVRGLEKLSFIAAAATLAAVVFMHREHWAPLLFSPIKHVQLQGAFIRIDRVEVERLVAGGLGRHFFDTDLHALKRAVETMPWVRRARVSRMWPQTLRLEIEEHGVAARWGAAALLSPEGEVFRPLETGGEGLPVLYGTAGLERTVLARYRKARDMLADVAKIDRVGEDGRGSWSLRLANGIAVKVGDGHWESRLARFVSVWRGGLDARATEIESVDLRYPDGLAVAWRKQ